MPRNSKESQGTLKNAMKFKRGSKIESWGSLWNAKELKGILKNLKES